MTNKDTQVPKAPTITLAQHVGKGKCAHCAVAAKWDVTRGKKYLFQCCGMHVDKTAAFLLGVN